MMMQLSLGVDALSTLAQVFDESIAKRANTRTTTQYRYTGQRTKKKEYERAVQGKVLLWRGPL